MYIRPAFTGGGSEMTIYGDLNGIYNFKTFAQKKVGWASGGWRLIYLGTYGIHLGLMIIIVMEFCSVASPPCISILIASFSIN